MCATPFEFGNVFYNFISTLHGFLTIFGFVRPVGDFILVVKELFSRVLQFLSDVCDTNVPEVLVVLNLVKKDQQHIRLSLAIICLRIWGGGL